MNTIKQPDLNRDSPILQSNPKANYLAYKDEIDAAVARVLNSGWYILGSEVSAFEQEFASYIGAEHAVGVASGTDALHVALKACGVGEGDIVYTVSHTAVATVTAIELCGATPVFVDIDPEKFVMDPHCLSEEIQATIVGRPKAIVPVHLYGHPVDMTAIMEIAERHELYVIEDCAQSHGAMWQGRKTGTWGHLAAFSFYPTKNLGALGDGGIVVTNDPDLNEQVRLIREYGWRERYISSIAGMNSRLDEMQAAILRVKLLHLNNDNKRRRQVADRYDSLLADRNIVLPGHDPQQIYHVYHQYVVSTDDRDSLQNYLKEQGIGTSIHYPVPVHQQPAYTRFSRHSLEFTESAAQRILSLPIYPELNTTQVTSVAHCIMQWIEPR